MQTIQRLEATTGDRKGCREVATAVANTEGIITFAVPPAEVAHRNGPGIQGCTPPQGGAE